MSEPVHSNRSGALLALAAFAVWATHDLGVKYLGASYSAVQIVFFSVLFNFPLATLMLISDPVDGHLRPIHPWWNLLRAISGVAGGVSAFYAFSTLPLTQVYALIFAAPLLVTILSVPILGETVRLKRWCAVVLGLCGVFVVLRPGATTLGLGHAAALVTAVGTALSAVIVRRIGREERSVVLILYPMLANVVVMGAALPFVYEPMPASHLGLLALISVMAFGATSLIIAAYKRGEAVIVAPMQYSQIIWATLYGALFFSERPDRWTMIGAGIIIASGIYIVLREGTAGASENRPVLRMRLRPETGTFLRSGLLMMRKGRTETGDPEER
ncbi:DMT family transporter [Roseicyclus sp. F158]|uniref:DMT family transporter n=1 Tax=Tropicimonas omnivorans TaxID=3075590 RepID=A0ABU3DL12_9RHOB|nr:DMT family transporter [Roseicyclus sp. F158]MDT0684409.1 DMT family transporter [Roseicyclus sp. F158]